MASIVRLLKSTSKKCLLGEVLVLIGQKEPEILSSLCFVTYSVLASREAQVPKSLKTHQVCLKSTHLVKFWCGSVNQVLRYWAASILYYYVHISEANKLLEVIFSPVKRFCTGLSIFDANLAKSVCLEDWPLQRSEDLNFSGPCFSDKKALHMQNLTKIGHQVPELCNRMSRKLQMPVPL